jgi:ABC-2 type transport system permease protein
MFRAIFLFELQYRKNRAATYIYFGIIFFVCFMTAASPTRPATGATVANSPYLIANITALMSLAFIMVTSAIVGVSVIRDFEHNTEALLFTTPLTKRDYLIGRFVGSFVILILINCAGWLGLMTGFAVGKFLPWEIAWKEGGLLPFQAWHYFQPFLMITVTNLFITGALFFMSGALGRNSIVIYTQGIVLLVLYQLGFTLVGNIETKPWAAIIDPFGIQTIQYVTRYWTPVERNSLPIPVEGILFYNRLLWISVGFVALTITYLGFSFNTVRKTFTGKKQLFSKTNEPPTKLIPIPVTHQAEGLVMQWNQLWQSTLLYVRMIIKEIPFLTLMITGILLVGFNAIKMVEVYGASTYPTTYSVLRALSAFNLPLLIVAIFYPGELVWKERSAGFAFIADAMPVPSFIGLVSKFMALFFIYSLLLFALAIGGVLIQAAYGHFAFDLPVFLGTLFAGTLTSLVLYTLFAFFIHVLVNEKFLAFTLSVAFFIVNSLLNRMGLEHDLWQFGSGSLGTFSDMNGYGHSVIPFLWLKLYWLGFSMLLFIVAVVFAVRGSETLIQMRWKAGKFRITRPLIILSLASATVFLFSGMYIYYNTTVLNPFETSSQIEQKQALYEKKFKQYEFLPQPKIVESNLKMDIYPSTRDFQVEGFYYLKNQNHQPVSKLHIQQNTDHQTQVGYLQFDRSATVIESIPEFGYTIYGLDKPLQPGDSLKMSFQLSFRTEGFEESGSNTDIVYNGTFLNNSYLPSLGYNDGFELSDNSNRRKQGLEVKERMLAEDDSRGKQVNIFGDDADHMRFEIVVSTESDQTAVAPGYLEKTWQQDGRNYFHYKMRTPMANFYSVVSARYAVKRDTWQGVNLEIYYHPGHEFNLERMMTAMKKSLDYYSSNFGPFQYTQLRITEFPRYTVFAQSFANTIPFSEGMGFIFKGKNPEKDMDMPFYVTAHEVAHQWWGHQVTEAKVKGSAMLSESMAQYSALMVMQHELPQEAIGRYLKYELDSYLAGRATEQKQEQPLYLVEKQNYIHYNKASLAFYALQDLIGEDKINTAFRNYNREWAFQGAPYPTSSDLLRHLRLVTPDSLQYLIHDMFETITLFENKAVEAVYVEKPHVGYEVTLRVSCEKIRADSVGLETDTPLHDWIDIGVYSGERLIHLKKYLFAKTENTITIWVKERPTHAGIDPLHKLIDRHTNDNTIRVVSLLEVGNLPVE